MTGPESQSSRHLVGDGCPHVNQQGRDFLDDHNTPDPRPAYDDPTEKD